jgi:hypothetical protein
MQSAKIPPRQSDVFRKLKSSSLMGILLKMEFARALMLSVDYSNLVWSGNKPARAQKFVVSLVTSPTIPARLHIAL